MAVGLGTRIDPEPQALLRPGTHRDFVLGFRAPMTLGETYSPTPKRFGGEAVSQHGLTQPQSEGSCGFTTHPKRCWGPGPL